MTVTEIMDTATAAGIQFRLDGEQVRVAYPPDRKNQVAPILGALREHRAEVVQALRGASKCPGAKCGGCYPIGDGKMIHPPRVRAIDWSHLKPATEKVQ